jgi:hypothetical protein
MKKQTIVIGIVAVFFVTGWRPASATVFPIPPELIRQNFSTDALAGQLEEDLDRADKTMKELHDILARYEGYKKPCAFTPAKYKTSYTMEQIDEWQKTGWVKTNEFGWPILKDKVLNVLPGWLEGFSKDVHAAAEEFPGNHIPEEKLKALVSTEEQISDFIGLQRHYVQRTRNWDEWCRKGPWLLEDAPPKKLARQIDLLTDYMNGKQNKEEVLRALIPDPDERSDLGRERLSDNLAEKKIVYDWYYGFAPREKRGRTVTLTPRGYELRVSICLFGEGARDEAAALLKNGIEAFWRGSVDGIPFRTFVDVRRLKPGDTEPQDCLKVRIGAECDKNVWPSDTELPYDFDKETAAHEFGHALGFRDRYRDVYDFNTKTYKTYQWDLFTLMSAQNGPDPVVTEADLEHVVESFSSPDSPERPGPEKKDR